MARYYRIMLGRAHAHASEALAGNFVGADFNVREDLASAPEEWRDFNHVFIPKFMKDNPTKTRMAAGLATGTLWRIAKGIKTGDVVLCPNGQGQYAIGEINGGYHYVPGDVLPHRRGVRWFDQLAERTSMSEALQRSTGSIGTISEVTRHADEIVRYIGRAVTPSIIAIDKDIEDPSAFALEQHLEDFLVENWRQTELGKEFNIYEEEGEPVGQQYETDTGPIDILAVSKNKKILLVVELKKGRASDAVVGQVLRYMGFVKEELAEDGQEVRGAIIALEDDKKLRRALAVANGIDFYRYKVVFTLHRA